VRIADLDDHGSILAATDRSRRYGRRMFRPLIALTAAAAAAVPVLAAPAGAADDTGLRVYVSNCIKQVYQPKTITLACADAGFVVNKIRYSSYGAKRAAGTGTAVINTCDPSCVAGKDVRYPARIALSRVTQCGDSYQFRSVRVTFTNKIPKGYKRTYSQRFPCADAPTR
jgi:hypothetical protein